MNPGHMLRIFSLLTLIALLMVLGSAPASAAPDVTITVNSTADVIADDGQCTLREAITAVNSDAASGSTPGECPAGSGADTIVVPAGVYTLTLAGTDEDYNATGDLDIRSDVTINGAGADTTIIQAGTTDSNGIDRVIHVWDSSGDLTLEGVTVRHGLIAGAGGGVLNQSGALTVRDSTISDNTTGEASGGGVYDDGGSVTIENSTLSGNSAGIGRGGGLYVNGGTVTILNSTISGNSTPQTGEVGGGGLYVNGDTVSIEHSTITNNTSAVGEGIIVQSGTVNLKNTIIAGNGSGANADCYNFSGSFNSLGYNLVGAGTGCPSGGTGDQTTGDPGLDPLADYGGTTQTHALQSESPALDAISNGTNGCGTEFTSDQRGESRPQSGSCDVGAFELVPGPKTWDGDGGDGLWSTAANWDQDTLPATWDKVLLDNAAPTSITLDTNVTIKDLTISGAGVSFSPGGVFTLSLEGFIQSDGAFTAPSSISILDNFDHSGGTYTHNNGSVTFNGGTIQTYSGTTVFYDVTVESGSTLQLATSCDFGFAGILTLDGGFDATSNSPTTLRLAGSGVQTLPSGLELDYLIINSTATFSAPTTLNVAGGWTNSGGFTHNSSTVTFNEGGAQIFSGTTAFFNVTVESGSTLYLAANSDFGYAGTFTLNGSLDTTTYTPNTVRLAYGGTQSLPSGATTLHSLAIESGATLSAPTSLSLAGDLTNGGVFTHNSGTVTFNGSGTQLYGGTTIFHDVTVESGSTLQLAADSDFGYEGTFTLNGSFDATTTSSSTVRLAWSGTQSLPSGATTLHSLVIESGATLSAQDLYIAGDWTNIGSFIHNSGVVWFNGSGAQTISGTNTFHNLYINNSSPTEKVDASGSTMKVNRKLEVRDGIFVSASDYDDVEIGSDGTLELSGDITVSLNWESYGSFVPNNHRVTFDGDPGQGFDGATIFHDVTVESGTSLVLGQNSDFGYSGAVTLNGGFHATGSPPTTVRLAGDGVQTLPPGETEFHHLIIDSDAILSAPTGNLYIGGDWTNSGGFQANGGKMILDGTGTQTLAGVTSFHNLTVESGSTLQLATDAVLGYSGQVIADGTLDLLTNAPTTLMVAGSRYPTPLHTTTHHLVINDGLLGYWKLDDAPGSTAADSSGYGHTGAMNGDPVWSTGTPPSDFNNLYTLGLYGGDYVEVPHSGILTPGSELTLTAWVKLQDPSADQKIVGKTNGTPNAGYVLGVKNNAFFPEVWDSTGTQYGHQAGTIPTDTWTHLAVTWQTGGQMIGYIDGTQVFNEAASTNPIGASTNPLRMGVAPWDISKFHMGGYVDDVRVYNQALSATEISELADGEHPLTSIATTSLGAALDVDGDLTLNSGTVAQTQIAGYWKLDEGSGTTAGDTSANSYNGTLTSGPVWSTDTPSTHFSNAHSLHFDGSNDYVDIPGTTTIDDLQSLTIAAWVKLESFPGHNMRFVTLRNEKTVLRYENAGTGRLHFYMKDDGSTFHNIRVDDALSTGTWIHVAGVNRDGTMSVYVNGEEQTGSASIGTVATGNGVHLSSAGETLDGWLDDVRVYNGALSTAEIQALAAGYDARTHDINVAGDFVRNGGVFEAGEGLITFDGSGTQTLDTDAITLHHVFLPAGTTLDTEADLTVNGDVLRQNNSATEETRNVEGTGVLEFPLAEVNIEVTTQGSLSSLVVHRQETDHPHRAAAIVGGAYWTITPAGTGYTGNLTLPHEAYPDPYACRYEDPDWGCVRDSYDSSTVTRNGITELSDWTVGYEPCAAAAMPTNTGISLSGTDVDLSWENSGDNVGYEVHRSTSPYFTPDSGSLYETRPAGSTSYTDAGAGGSTGENYSYIVRGIGTCGTPSGYEKRLGEFDFGLVPGNE